MPAAVLISLLGATCGRTSPSETALSFTVSPIATTSIEFITALGNLNPPGHTLPTDHIYFYHHLNHPAAPQFEVVAPAPGQVSSILHHAGDLIYVRVSDSVKYYLDHVTLDPSIVNGQTLAAGQRLGVTTEGAYGLDLGVVNNDVTIGFVKPQRYSENSLHCDAPLKYFTEPLKSTLYGTVTRQGPDKDGQINYDVSGRLSGNWFLEGLSMADSANANGWPMQLSFSHDVIDPAILRVGIGGTLAMQGAFTLVGAPIDPSTVSPVSGLVEYQLAVGPTTGIMLVEMLAGDRIRVETFPGATPGTVAFSSAARIYLR